VAFLVLFTASARAGIISSDVRAGARTAMVDLPQVGREINFSARWTAEGESRVAILVRYGEVTHAQNIHPDQDINTAKQNHLCNREHCEHNFVWKAKIDEMARSGQCTAANPYGSRTNDWKLKIRHYLRRYCAVSRAGVVQGLIFLALWGRWSAAGVEGRKNLDLTHQPERSARISNRKCSGIDEFRDVRTWSHALMQYIGL
jgi:hypothetical protein